MLWATREHVHFDRVISPWVIKRFVDEDAKFLFVPWGKEDERPAEAIPLALPGHELGPNDGDGTTFHKVLLKYGLLGDEALAAMDQIVTNGIENTRYGAEYPRDRLGELAAGVQALSEGVLLLSRSDSEQLERSFPLFDALYATLQMELLMRARGEERPQGGLSAGMWRTVFSMALGIFLRRKGRTFSSARATDLDEAFEAQLARLRAGRV